MSNSDWRDSEQESHKPRPAIQGRTELEDSLLAARREDHAQERRRSAALSHALKARSIDSDPEGKKFLADREKAMTARRAENEKIDREKKSEDFSVSLFDVWEEAAHTSTNEIILNKQRRRRSLLAIGALVAICVLALALWLLGRMQAA